MNDPMKILLEKVKLGKKQFPVNSRYYDVETETVETAEGETVIYLKRRFISQPERFALLREHRVVEGDRLDNVTASYLEDPELFWRLADANNALHPEELTDEVGRVLRITQAEGVPGVDNA